MKWEFDTYTVYDEQEVLKFEDHQGKVLGYVSLHDHRAELLRDLNNGVDPIKEGWEDGLGNTITKNGWGT